MKKVKLTIGMLLIAQSVAIAHAERFTFSAQEVKKSSVCNAGYVIAHINGVFTGEDDARKNLRVLRNSTKDLGSDGKNKNKETGIKYPIKYNLLYNHGGVMGNPRDMIEMYVQKLGEYNIKISKSMAGKILYRIGDGIFTEPEYKKLFNDPDYKRLLKPDWRDKVIAEAINTINDFYAKSTNSTTNEIFEQLHSTLLQGRAVLVVAYSQGNFYANDVIDKLRTLDDFEQSQLDAVHIAVPTNRIAGSSYLTWKGDRVMKRVKELYHSTLPANYDDGINYLPLNSNVARWTGLDWSLFGGHDFSKIYFGTYNENTQKVLGHSGKKGELFPIGNAVKTLIANGLKKIKPGKSTTGPITVAVNWDKAGDVDLHINEPAGAHVFYENPRGEVGYLDRDDTTGTGPEHYYTSCENMKEGTYNIGLNHFADPNKNGNKTVSTNLSVFGKNYRTIRTTLGQERGTEGNKSPQPVVQVTLKKTGKTDEWEADVH